MLVKATPNGKRGAEVGAPLGSASWVMGQEVVLGAEVGAVQGQAGREWTVCVGVAAVGNCDGGGLAQAGRGGVVRGKLNKRSNRYMGLHQRPGPRRPGSIGSRRSSGRRCMAA